MLASLRVRLIMSHFVVILVAMAASGFLLLSLVEQYLLRAVEDSLIAQGHIVAEVLIPSATLAGPAIDTPSPAFNTIQQNNIRNLSLETQNLNVPLLSAQSLNLTYLANASLQLNSQLETRIRIINLQGAVLVDTQGTPGQALVSDALVAQGLSEGYAMGMDATEAGMATMRVVLPVTAENQVVGIIDLSQPLRDMTAVLANIRTRLFISTGIALLISAFVGLALSQAIARPVQQLTTTAEAIAQGQSLWEVTNPSQAHAKPAGELGRLRAAFFNMLTRLQTANRLQIDFVANVSHELRTPLASIKGMVETLQDGAVDDLTVRDRFLETIGRETDRLTRLIADLLVLSRADSHALTLNAETIDILQLAQAATAELQTQATTRRVMVTIQLAEVMNTLVWADPDRIKQVILNVLANAIQYSHPGGQVAICLDRPREEQQVCLKIQDNGPGIPAEALPLIGQRFFRVNRARSRTDGGSGLGLAIAQALTRAHGGQLKIESQEGQGTAVTLILPA